MMNVVLDGMTRQRAIQHVLIVFALFQGQSTELRFVFRHFTWYPLVVLSGVVWLLFRDRNIEGVSVALGDINLGI